LLLAASVATCNAIGLTGGGGGRNSLTLSPSALTVAQGRSGTVSITLSRSGRSNGAVSLGFTADAPPGITMTFDPPSLSGSTVSSTLTVATSLTSFPQTITPFVRAISTDGDTAIAQLSLTVTLLPPVFVSKAGTGAGTVTSSPGGIDCGTSCSKQFVTEVTLTAAPATGSTFAGWSVWGGAVCNGAALTCTFTPRATLNNSVVATFNSTVPSFSFVVSPSPVSVQQGGNTPVTASLTRINGYADPVTVAVSGAPSGITITPATTSITGASATLTVAAAASVGAGNYPVTITATGPGVAQQSVSLPIQVTQSSAGGNITANFASCDPTQIPVLFAVQNGTGPWMRITPTNNAFTFTMGATGAVAIVTKSGANATTQALYASGAEIASIIVANPCGGSATGTKTLNGTFANGGSISSGYTARVVVGGASFTKASDNLQGFTLPNVASGPRDLIASRTCEPGHQCVSLSANGPGLDVMLLRRGTNYGNNTTIPVIDFANTTESFAPKVGGVVISNLGAAQASLNTWLISANGESDSYYSYSGAGVNGLGLPFYGLPDTLLRSGDFHFISAAVPDGSGSATFRFAQILEHSPSVQTVTLGPQLGAATTVATLGTTPYLRLRASIPSQSTYTGGAIAEFKQSANAVSILMSAAYIGSAGATWTLDIPDLSGAGYDPAWALASGSGVSWMVNAVSGNVLPFVGGAPVDNAQLVGAGAQGSSSSFAAPLRVGFGRRPRH
jgi:hypothetical protein